MEYRAPAASGSLRRADRRAPAATARQPYAIPGLGEPVRPAPGVRCARRRCGRSRRQRAPATPVRTRPGETGPQLLPFITGAVHVFEGAVFPKVMPDRASSSTPLGLQRALSTTFEPALLKRAKNFSFRG